MWFILEVQDVQQYDLTRTGDAQSASQWGTSASMSASHVSHASLVRILYTLTWTWDRKSVGKGLVLDIILWEPNGNSCYISRCFICHSLGATKQELACLMSDRQTWIGVLDVYNQKPTWHDRWYWENKWHLDKNNDDAAVNLNLVNLNLQMSKWLFSFLIKAIKHKNKTYSV